MSADAKSTSRSTSTSTSAYNTLVPKLALFVIFVVSTLLMLETRELLNAAATGDQSDAAYVYGL